MLFIWTPDVLDLNSSPLHAGQQRRGERTRVDVSPPSGDLNTARQGDTDDGVIQCADDQDGMLPLG